MDIHDIKTLLPSDRAILDAGPGAVAVMDINTFRLLYVNDQFVEVFGFSKEQVSDEGFTFRKLMDESHLERFIFQVDNVKNNPSQHSKYVVYRLHNSAGEQKPYYLYVAPIKEYSNLYHILVIPDLSSWAFPFNSFDARDLFLQQLETERYGSFEWMLDSSRVFWTDTLYDIYELARGTFIDREVISSFTHPDDSKKGKAAVQRAMETTGKIDLEMKIVTGKKNIKVVRVLAKIVNNDAGIPVKMVGSVKDITTQRKIEQDLKRKVEELNRSNKELEEFAYVASHDLQEPLRKISTFSDRLSEKYTDVLTGEGLMYLERMMASAENMRNLINNLLEFSRVTRDVQPFTEVDLGTLLKQVCNELELVIEETGTAIENDKLPIINGSVSQLDQLFTNIISNAIKFRKTGEKPFVRITSEPVLQEEALQYHLNHDVDYCKITFRDNGIGFENEYAVRIFQIFQRLNGKSEYPGSGIGLAICKRIVEHHNGIIWAESEEGKGAAFIVILPLAHAKQ
jgi:PAS domain S-box-containing protein